MLTIRVSECPCECPSCKVGSPAALGCCLSIHFVICVSPHFDTALSFSYLCCFDIADSPDLRPQILRRRPVMLSTIMLFALGSTICGAASSMNMLIAGRGLSCAFPTVKCLFQIQSNSQSLFMYLSWGPSVVASSNSSRLSPHFCVH